MDFLYFEGEIAWDNAVYSDCDPEPSTEQEGSQDPSHVVIEADEWMKLLEEPREYTKGDQDMLYARALREKHNPFLCNWDRLGY